MKLFKFDYVIFLGTKKIISFIVDVRNVCDKPCCYDILVLEELITSVSSFGKKYTLWVEMKCFLGLKSDVPLACHLLNTTVTVSNMRK